MTIQNFDRPTVRSLSAEIVEALKEIGERHGVTISAGRGSYTPETFNMKLEINTAAGNGEAETRAMKDLKRHMLFLGLEEKHLDQEFTLGGKVYKIAGYRPKATKNNVVVRNQNNGKEYVVPLYEVKQALGIENPFGPRSAAEERENARENAAEARVS